MLAAAAELPFTGRRLKTKFSTIAFRQPALMPLFITVPNQSGNRAYTVGAQTVREGARLDPAVGHLAHRDQVTGRLGHGKAC